MQALKLPARRGWLWLAGGFAIFRKNPPLLTFLVISYLMLIVLMNQIPLIGPIVAWFCVPAFSVSLMNACRELEQGRPIGVLTLFSGFRENPRAMLTLGGIYFGAMITILVISSLADGGLLMDRMLFGTPHSNEAGDNAQFFSATHIFLFLLIPLAMAYWYAPALTAWHGLPAGKALFFSVVAGLRNWRAFIAYVAAIMVFGAIIPGVILSLLTRAMPQSVNFFAALFMVPMLLIFAPTLFASVYASYRDVFVAIDESA
jgi:hypothetical protein